VTLETTPPAPRRDVRQVLGAREGARGRGRRPRAAEEGYRREAV